VEGESIKIDPSPGLTWGGIAQDPSQRLRNDLHAQDEIVSDQILSGREIDPHSSLGWLKLPQRDAASLTKNHDNAGLIPLAVRQLEQLWILQFKESLRKGGFSLHGIRARF